MRYSSAPLFALVLLLGAARVSADPIQIAWNDCAGADGALDRMEFACDRNTGVVMPVVVSFTAPTLPDFVGTTTKLEIRVDGGVVPAWWQLQPGGCRSGALGPSVDAVGGLSGFCTNPFEMGQHPAQMSNTVLGADGVIRIEADAVIGGVGSVQPGQRYTAIVINLRPQRTVSEPGRPACAGCGADAYIFVTEVLVAGTYNQVVLRPAGAPPAIVYSGADSPRSVPVARSTFGALKALYR